jgi:hypothetical protein
MGIVSVSVQILSDDPIPVPVDGVLVRVYDGSDVFVTEGLTGSPNPAGQVDFLLNGTTSPGTSYKLRLSKTNYSFPPNATKNISVTDPPAPSNVFTFTAHAGPTALVAKIVVKDEQVPTPQPVNGVKVRVYSALDAFITEGETGVSPDAAGEFSLALQGSATPGTTYFIRLLKAGLTFPLGATQEIQVLDPVAPPLSNIFDITAHVVLLPESTNPDLCKLSGYLVDVSLRPLKNRPVEFRPISFYPDVPHNFTSHFPGHPTLVQRSALIAPVKALTDKEGYVEVELPRGGGYSVHIHGIENPVTITEHIIVPDQAGFKLEDVLFNYVKQVTYMPAGPINLNVGDTEEIEIDVRGSNEFRIELVEDLSKLIEFSVADSAKASVKLTDKNLLTVEGLAAGSTTIEVARKPNTVAPRIPTVANIIATPPSIVVT